MNVWCLIFPWTAGQEKPKPKKAIDLFDDVEDEDGDIFGDKHSAPAVTQAKKEVEAEQVKPPEKKVNINSACLTAAEQFPLCVVYHLQYILFFLCCRVDISLLHLDAGGGHLHVWSWD